MFATNLIFMFTCTYLTYLYRRVNDYLFLYSHMETCQCNPFSPNSLDCQMLTRVDWSSIHKMLYRAYIDNHKVILEILVYNFFYLNALLFKITENWCLTKERNSKQIKENEKEIVVCRLDCFPAISHGS